MSPGPRHRGALIGLSRGNYIGYGNAPTFRGRGPAIPARLMCGLVDRGWARVMDGDTANAITPVWRAEITEAGRKALEAEKVADVEEEAAA